MNTYFWSAVFHNAIGIQYRRCGTRKTDKSGVEAYKELMDILATEKVNADDKYYLIAFNLI